MRNDTRDANNVYIEAGEGSETRPAFSVEELAQAFEVDAERVRRALDGEFGLGPDAPVDRKMAHLLSEVLLADLPLDRQEAALMRLGAYTPRRDATEGLGHAPPGEESDRQNAKVGVPDDDIASKRSSHAPSTQTAK